MGSEWPRVAFAGAPVEIIDGDRGKNYPKQADFLESGHCLFLNTGNVTTDGFDFSRCQFITKDKDRILRKGKLKRHDLVMTTRGTVGNVAYYNNDVPFDHMRINSGMVIFRPEPTQIEPQYLYQFLRSAAFKSQVAALRTGSAQPQLPIRDINRIELPIPPLVEQQAIACILGTLDNKIELNRRMNETLEGVARAIFKSWFVDFLPVRAKQRARTQTGDPVRAKAAGEQPPSLPPAIADLFPDTFEESELGEIPRGWTRTSLKRLFPLDSNCVITGPFGSNLHASDYRDEGVPLLLVKNIVNGAIVEDGVPLVGWHKASELERYRLKLGDIIFTRVGAVGRSAYIHPRHVGWMISGQTLRVNISDWGILHPRYLASVFQHPAFIAMVESHALGTTRPSLNTNILENFEFLYPPPELQLEYARTVAALDERRLANLNQIGILAALRNALLPKLVSGELRVPDAEKIVSRAW